MKPTQNTETHWVSLSDMMTGLMIIFLFIAIAYMQQRNAVFEDFKASKTALYQELDSTFKKDFQQWEVELDKNLSIKFTNPDILFDPGQADLKPKFRELLNSFFPRYLAIITQEKYKYKISEIRIEGHTDPLPRSSNQGESDQYIANIQLSQDRARNVLKHIRTLSDYRNLSDSIKIRMQFWLTANGLSYGRTLDDDKRLTFESKKSVNNKNSRRVEFRIITNSEQLVEEIIEKL